MRAHLVINCENAAFGETREETANEVGYILDTETEGCMRVYEACETCGGPLPYGGHVATPICDTCLDGGVIIIEYGAREVLGGMWQPYGRHGRRFIDWYEPRPLDKDEALRRAERWAREDASHYVGDWQVTIREATC